MGTAPAVSLRSMDTTSTEGQVADLKINVVSHWGWLRIRDRQHGRWSIPQLHTEGGEAAQCLCVGHLSYRPGNPPSLLITLPRLRSPHEQMPKHSIRSVPAHPAPTPHNISVLPLGALELNDSAVQCRCHSHSKSGRFLVFHFVWPTPFKTGRFVMQPNKPRQAVCFTRTAEPTRWHSAREPGRPQSAAALPRRAGHRLLTSPPAGRELQEKSLLRPPPAQAES